MGVYRAQRGGRAGTSGAGRGAAAAGGAGAVVEVERKFAAPPGGLPQLESAVAAAGGRPLGSATLSDCYWDTPDARLARRDVWLRARDSGWELKVPPRGMEDDRRSGGERGVFVEVEGLQAVVAALQEQGLVEFITPPPTSAAFEAALRAAGLAAFAEFETHRARFALPNGVSVDADVASFGHSVVELEQMVTDEAEVEEADARIRATAARLGLLPLGGTGGKLETFIRRHRPAHLRALIAAGLLAP